MLIQGDARRIPLRDASVDCVVTSPPYFGLRDYKVPGQIGLEATPAEYVETMTAVFREVRRVLKPKGTLWLNLGDSYYNGDKGGYCNDRIKSHDSIQRSNLAANFAEQPNRMPQLGLKPKDLVGMPWRVAFALQADGWWLRSDIIWAKPNPMPESVADRPTKAHESLFLLAKSERYFYDAHAIREPSKWPHGPNAPDKIKSPYGQGFTRRSGNLERRPGVDTGRSLSHIGRGFPWEGKTANARTVWTIATQPYPGAHYATFPEELVRRCILAGCPPGGTVLDPFVGSGTVIKVARKLGRNGVGLDLSGPYLVEQARERIKTDVGLPL